MYSLLQISYLRQRVLFLSALVSLLVSTKLVQLAIQLVRIQVRGQIQEVISFLCNIAGYDVFLTFLRDFVDFVLKNRLIFILVS